MNNLKRGDRIPTWFSGSSDGLSTVVDIKPYAGKMSCFTHTVTLTALNTNRRLMEMAVNLLEDQPDE